MHLRMLAPPVIFQIRARSAGTSTHLLLLSLTLTKGNLSPGSASHIAKAFRTYLPISQMSKNTVTLRAPLHPHDDIKWEFTYTPPNVAPRTKSGQVRGKHVTFKPDGLVLNIDLFPSNRILHHDDPSEFVLASFGEFRFPNEGMSGGALAALYMKRFFAAGLVLNGKMYRFYGHSNSQLRSRSCFLRAARTDIELDRRIHALGDFETIKNIAKRAKRIGLLFSGAEVDYDLDPKYIKDIPDIKDGDELFSDGQLRADLHTPCPANKEKKEMVHFRKSMKKFTTTIDNTLSIVDYSIPYAFGRLNSDIVVLLSALGVPNDKLTAKQASYFQWLTSASDDLQAAVDLLSAAGKHELVERVLLHGFDDQRVKDSIRACQDKEISAFKKNDKERVRMILPESRLLFGVCDPFKVLQPGEVHVRITDRKGARTLKAIDVMVIRNPCLHPGDLLKLRATEHPALAHLVDCVVFASKGKRAAPSMSSGGDLDGDRYFVCWDKDIVPSKIAESYTYPPNKERTVPEVTRADMANYFANYNSAGLALVSALHRKWAILSGAMSPECQELNALHSQSVDGARIKIPDRLREPPAPSQPFILELLANAARAFAETFSQQRAGQLARAAAAGSIESSQVTHELLMRLLTTEDPYLSLSEVELVQMALQMCRTLSEVDRPYYLERYLNNIDFGALPELFKRSLLDTLDTIGFIPKNSMLKSKMWNSLLDSEILKPGDLVDRRLDRPLRLQRLYASHIQGRPAFFEYLKQAMEDYTRKVIILKTDDRFSVGIFIRGRFEWDADPVVDDNVTVCSFQPTSSESNATYRTMKKGYVLHCSENLFQLYERARRNTFIFLMRPPEATGKDLAVSIALQKFDTRIQQIGRLNRTPVEAIEIHVVSHRDREAHQLFDLRFAHVETEEVLPRFPRQRVPYQKNSIKTIDWDTIQPDIGLVFDARPHAIPTTLARLSDDALHDAMDLSLKHHANEHIFLAFQEIFSRDAMCLSLSIWLDKLPVLVFPLLKQALQSESTLLPDIFLPKTEIICRSIILSANTVGIASLVALEKLSDSICQLSLKEYFDLLWLASLTIRSFQLCHETLMVLSESRVSTSWASASMIYAHKYGLAVVCDRAEEAADQCPCDDFGKPRKQSKAPAAVRAYAIPDEPLVITVHIRVDKDTFNAARLGTHVRLRADSIAENDNRNLERIILDGVVVQSGKGEIRVQLFQEPPPELDQMGWLLYLAGSVTTSRAMLDAVYKLATEGWDACRLHGIITGSQPQPSGASFDTYQLAEERNSLETFNSSQKAAVLSISHPLSLIWGPPGTGKTTVVVALICRLVKNLAEGSKILVTASTHNAVDNVLERFAEKHVLPTKQIIRVATDYTKVSKNLQAFTIDAALGGSPSDNPALIRKAEQRVKDAVVVFTTCTGAGLGVLRKIEFPTVIIDEASQVNEPCALIPLVKGCHKAILVGDHVQLRPTVRPLGEALEFDMSLLERLYTRSETPSGMIRTMLDVQYRFPEELARFPSNQFYEGRLKTGTQIDPQQERTLRHFSFPWPVNAAQCIIPNVFVPCTAPEELGRASKANLGQVALVAHVVNLLTKGVDALEEPAVIQPPQIAVLSPYSRQVKELQRHLPSSVSVSTIDGFQGRESDIIVFSTVRSNIEGDLGFVDNARRLNVAWTRARWARIVVGDKVALTKKSELWRKAIADSQEVHIQLPKSDNPAT